TRRPTTWWKTELTTIMQRIYGESCDEYYYDCCKNGGSFDYTCLINGICYNHRCVCDFNYGPSKSGPVHQRCTHFSKLVCNKDKQCQDTDENRYCGRPSLPTYNRKCICK